MLDDRSSKDQTKRLAKLGIEISPERPKEIHAGSPHEPSECEVDPSVIVKGAGETPEEMQARLHRQLFREFAMEMAMVCVVTMLVMVLIVSAGLTCSGITG